jgi:heptosyltransferase-2
LDQNKVKILIIRLSSLGDILLTTPVIRALKKNKPDAQIDVLVRKQYFDAIKNNPYIDNIFTLSHDNFQELKSTIKKNDYDLIIDLQGNLRSRWLCFDSQAPIRRINKPAINKWLLVNTKFDLLHDFSIPKLYAETAHIILDDEGLEIFIDDSIKPRIDLGDDYIGICPGSRHKTKMWPAEYYIELGKKLTADNYRVLVFGGKDDKEICNEITEEIPNAINLQTENELLQMASELKLCKLVISNDSGLMHVASAVKTPVVALFGSTVKSFGFSPYGVKYSIIENAGLNCRPCSHIGLEKCPKNHFKCMKDLTPDLVYKQIKNFTSTL